MPLWKCCAIRELLRLNVGIFGLHAVLMSLFVVVPQALVRAGLPAASHSQVYLGAVGAGFLLMLPFVAVRRIARHERAVFLGSIAVVGVGVSVLAAAAGPRSGCWRRRSSSFSRASTF